MSNYLNEVNQKGANDKAPKEPHTLYALSNLRILKRSFYRSRKITTVITCSPMQRKWTLGQRVKAAGGNKDDMLRIAWDNGKYGQHFKSANTVKGSVNLYWNVLITGTLPQVLNYFKNVENGLVTRCSFCSIDNQEFADAPSLEASDR